MGFPKIILIAGAGAMGRKVAEVMALAKFEVQLWDRSPGNLGRSSAAVERALRKHLISGQVTDEELEESLERIRLISDFRVVRPDTGLVFEAIIEEMAPKQALLVEAEKRLPNSWFASVSKNLSISEMAKALPRPERLVGLRFGGLSLPEPLVEIVCGVQTDVSLERLAQELVTVRIGAKAVVLKEGATRHGGGRAA
jgi:3-hydroxybutyryl-CoA dehydrogenase